MYYKDTGAPLPDNANKIYPKFVWEFLPPGVSGLVIAAVLAAAMSNLSAALNALASTTVMDFFKPISTAMARERSEESWLALSKRITIVWGGILFAVALAARGSKSVLEEGLSIASVLYGALLGVFLLGMLTKRVGEKAAMAGMVAGFATMLYVRLGTHIAFTWYGLIGTSATVLVGLAASYLWKEEAAA